jgi:hypothetical protein
MENSLFKSSTMGSQVSACQSEDVTESQSLLSYAHSELDPSHASRPSDSFHSLNAEHPTGVCENSQPPNNHLQNSFPSTTQPISLKPWTCYYPGCGRAYEKESKLKTHQLTHGWFRCTATKCKSEFESLRELDAHRLVSFSSLNLEILVSIFLFPVFDA